MIQPPTNDGRKHPQFVPGRPDAQVTEPERYTNLTPIISPSYGGEKVCPVSKFVEENAAFDVTKISNVGCVVGSIVGFAEGLNVGSNVGSIVGYRVGLSVATA